MLKPFGLLRPQKTGVVTPFLFTITVGAGESFTMPHQSFVGNNFDYTINWGDSNENQVTYANDPNSSHTYIGAGTYPISVIGICEVFRFQNLGDKLKMDSVESLGNIEWYQIDFFGCINITSFIAGANVNTTNVISLLSFLESCETLTTLSIDNMDVSNVTNFKFTFRKLKLLTILDIPNWDTQSATLMYGMFDNMLIVTAINQNLNTALVTDMTVMVEACYELTSFDDSGFDVGNVILMNYMYYVSNKITSPAQESWWDGSNPQITGHTDVFYNNTLRSNFGDIPASWK